MVSYISVVLSTLVVVAYAFVPSQCPTLSQCSNPQINQLGQPTFVSSAPAGLICIYGNNTNSCLFSVASQLCAFQTQRVYLGPENITLTPDGQVQLKGC
ncbi:hypothetical protein MIR68_004409 [Amoeboaphelidium protococcarum]|nr:hypothetical protein MIR68_004409 [Amoeboaphelidium protococcarum]KAI3654696.1 hypothetical protein MP228_000076 [Amoeboaphelidium protococcarum]